MRIGIMVMLMLASAGVGGVLAIWFAAFVVGVWRRHKQPTYDADGHLVAEGWACFRPDGHMVCVNCGQVVDPD